MEVFASVVIFKNPLLLFVVRFYIPKFHLTRYISKHDLSQFIISNKVTKEDENTKAAGKTFCVKRWKIKVRIICLKRNEGGIPDATVTTQWTENRVKGGEIPPLLTKKSCNFLYRNF